MRTFKEKFKTSFLLKETLQTLYKYHQTFIKKWTKQPYFHTPKLLFCTNKPWFFPTSRASAGVRSGLRSSTNCKTSWNTVVGFTTGRAINRQPTAPLKIGIPGPQKGEDQKFSNHQPSIFMCDFLVFREGIYIRKSSDILFRSKFFSCIKNCIFELHKIWKWHERNPGWLTDILNSQLISYDFPQRIRHIMTNPYNGS